MANERAKSKRRHSLAENEAVLTALAEIARQEDTTVTAHLPHVVRFKRQQRDFDRALLEMGLASPRSIQHRNSIVRARRSI